MRAIEMGKSLTMWRFENKKIAMET